MSFSKYVSYFATYFLQYNYREEVKPIHLAYSKGSISWYVVMDFD